MKQIAADVYVEDQFSKPPRFRGCNPSFVTTSEGIVMIDTPMRPTDAIKWRDNIAQKGQLRYIINTDHHPDHITGNYFFPGIVVSHELVREAVKASTGLVDNIRLRIKELDPEGLPLLDEHYQLRAPTITFTERLALYVGEYTFELIHLPGHTPAHIGIYIPQERIFFAGDNFTNSVQPSFADCLPLQWVESLKKIEAMDIDVVVPGHDEVCDKSKIREFRLFIQRCIDMVSEAIEQGVSKEQAADTISFEGYYPSVLTGPEVQRTNVLRLYEMLSK